MMRKCLMCDKEYRGEEDDYQFCDKCVWKLGILEVNLDEAEKKLKANK